MTFRGLAGCLTLLALACTPTGQEPEPQVGRVEPLPPERDEPPNRRDPPPDRQEPEDPRLQPTPAGPRPYAFRCFGPPIKTPLDTSPFGVRNADVDGDGALDLIGVSSTMRAGQRRRHLSIWLGQRDGAFVLASAEPYAGGGLQVSVADFVGDEQADLLIGNYDVSSFSLWRGEGGGRIVHHADIATGKHPREPHLGDLDGDGDLDLVLPRHREVEIHLNLGGGRFRRAAKLLTAASSRMSTPENLSLGDVDGDGDLDLAIPLSDDNALEVWLGRGDGRFERHARYDEPCGSPSHSALIEVDGDVQLDLVLGCGGLQALIVARGDGQGGFDLDGAQQLELAGHPSEVTTAQLRRDAASSQDDPPEIIVAGALAGAFERHGGRRDEPHGFMTMFTFDPGRDAMVEWDHARLQLHVTGGIGVEELDGDGFPDLIYAATGQTPGSYLATLRGRACAVASPDQAR